MNVKPKADRPDPGGLRPSGVSLARADARGLLVAA